MQRVYRKATTRHTVRDISVCFLMTGTELRIGSTTQSCVATNGHRAGYRQEPGVAAKADTTESERT
jgi:hypothetical protein